MSKAKTDPTPTAANRTLYVLLGLVLAAALAFLVFGRPLLFGDDTTEPIELPGIGARADQPEDVAGEGDETEQAEGEQAEGEEPAQEPAAETPRPRDPFRQVATE